MPLGMFVNPVPGLHAKHYLQFDFPVHGHEYAAQHTRPNIDLLAPAIEQLYGKLGTPEREQGNPFMAEYRPEIEDPRVYPYQDQIVDIDREVTIYHTGRLSGSFVPFIANNQFESTVRIDAIQNQSATTVSIDTIAQGLTPGANQRNTWFWLNNPNKYAPELIFTACTKFCPQEKGLIAGELYKLNIRWEFRYLGYKKPIRTGISGFDETVAFQVSEPTLIP